MKRNRLANLTLLLAIIFSASAVIAQDSPRYKELPNFHRVSDTLFRGAQPRDGGLRKLAELGIKTIINLRDNDARAQAEEKEAIAAGFTYFNIPLARLGRPDEDSVRRVIAIIDAVDKQPVFVHCRQGADRTGVIIGVYRIVHDGWNSERAKAEAKKYGMKPWQLGMKDYLHDYYERFKPKTSAAKTG
jgi:protein tyrosine/serine phosphatase